MTGAKFLTEFKRRGHTAYSALGDFFFLSNTSSKNYVLTKTIDANTFLLSTSLMKT